MKNITSNLHYGLLLISALVGNGVAYAQSSNATNSLELAVPNSFLFSNHREVTIDISVADEAGNPMTQTFVHIFAVMPSEDGVDEHESLVFVGKTNNAGWLTTQVDFPHYVEQAKVVAKSTGFEKTHVVELSETNSISAVF